MSTGLKRETLDKYYTDKGAVELCGNLIKEHVDISDADLCIEPSAGNGAFIPFIEGTFNNYSFYDLKPEDPRIDTLDFTTFKFEGSGENKVHVVGNPPFGRQSSLAIKFIKISAQFCDSISFILPKSFKKDSMKKHFPVNFHLQHETDLPDDSFRVNGEKHSVPCVFQIWVKKDTPRAIPVPLVPNGYTFVKKQEPHDISFRRVGVYAGKIDTETADKSEQSHYFIKFNKPLSKAKFNKLAKIEFANKNNTVGPRSISKQELIEQFNTNNIH